MSNSHHGTLTADTVATVNLDNHAGDFEVVNRTGTGVIWVRFDGVDPVVAGDGTYAVVTTTRFRKAAIATAPLQVRLISSTTPAYSVQGGPVD